MPVTTEDAPPPVYKLECLRDEALARFPYLWRRMIRGWNAAEGPNRLWLMYSANYLMRTGGLRWAIDPVRLAHRLPRAPEVDAARDLAGLSLVVLTHRHEDHLDLELIHSLRELPITWVTPAPLLELVEGAGIARGRIIVPKMLEPIEFRPLRLTPFEGLHLSQHKGQMHGVPSVGYLAECGGRRWLFPGDTRTYDAASLPDFGEVDALFAHLWLGRGSAQLESPPLVDEFTRFCLALRPRRIVITHLNEFGRDPADLWDMQHAERACEALRQEAPRLQVTPAVMGDCVDLEALQE